MALLRVRLYGVPVKVAVVAAVGNEGVIRLHPPPEIMLQQRLPLADSGSHFRAIHHLRLPSAIPLHHLRQMEMIVELLVRHRGLQQGISVNIGASHGFALLSPASLFLII